MELSEIVMSGLGKRVAVNDRLRWILWSQAWGMVEHRLRERFMFAIELRLRRLP